MDEGKRVYAWGEVRLMSGPKMSAADIKKYRLFEQDRRRLYQDLVRMCDIQKRRLKNVTQLQDLCAGVMKEDAVKFRMQKLGRDAEDIRVSLKRMQAVMQERNNEEMRDVLQGVSARFAPLDEELAETEAFVRKVREEFFVKMMADSKKAKEADTVAAADAGAGADADAKIASFESLAKDEAARVLHSVSTLCESAEAAGIKEEEAKTLLANIEELVAEGRDAFSLYEEIHRIDVMKIRPLRDVIEKEERRLDELDARLSAELSKYHVLCREQGIAPKKFAFAEESVEAIRYESAGLIQKGSLKSDLRILMRNIRESLVELGYLYLGEKEEDRDFAREIYRIHDDVILHVIYDSTGRVTMEVAVEDEKDREPHPREVEKLVKEQVSFCTEYEKIFHLINQKGLEFRKDNLYPVSPDFAQVINTSEFVRAGEGAAAADAATDDYFASYGLRENKYLAAQI